MLLLQLLKANYFVGVIIYDPNNTVLSILSSYLIYCIVFSTIHPGLKKGDLRLENMTKMDNY